MLGTDVFDDNGDNVLQIEEFAKMFSPTDGLKGMGIEMASVPALDLSAGQTSNTPMRFLSRALSKANLNSVVSAGAASMKKKKKSSKVATKKEAGSKGSKKVPTQKSKADELRSASDLRAEADVYLAEAQSFVSRVSASEDTFERRLGAALVEKLKDEKLNKATLTKMIREWDRNGDGELDKIEFRQAVRKTLLLDRPSSNAEIDGLFQDFDSDNSGKLDLNELKPALQALKDAAAAGAAHEDSLREAAESLRSRAANLIEAAETMNAVERDMQSLAKANTSALPVADRLGYILINRKISVYQACRNWEGIGFDANGHKKEMVNFKQFKQGLDKLKVQGTEDEFSKWFAKCLVEASKSVSASEKNILDLEPVVSAAIASYQSRAEQEAQAKVRLDASSKKATQQQERIKAVAEAVAEEKARAEEAAKKAEADQAAAQEAAKAAKFASFKRRKDKKAAEKKAYDAKIAARRNSNGIHTPRGAAAASQPADEMVLSAAAKSGEAAQPELW